MYVERHKERLSVYATLQKIANVALTLSCGATSSLSLEEYVDFVERNVDVRDVDSIAESAPALRALASDRTLVVKKLNERIETFVAGDAIPSAQTLNLARGQHFYVRANIWPAMSDMANGRAYQDQFAYNLAHDHNFTFLTVGYLGPGYETEIYEYDYEKVEGYVGEAVDMRFLEKVRFSSGMVMLYRASKDLHIQYAPEELTITLNLMVSLPEVQMRDQFYFDVAKRVISSYPGQLQAGGRTSLIALAGHVGDDETQELLNHLAKKHPCRRTRLAAFTALTKQRPQNECEIWTEATSDRAPLVANAALRHLRALEDSSDL